MHKIQRNDQSIKQKIMPTKCSFAGVLLLCLVVRFGLTSQELFKKKELLKIDSIVNLYKTKNKHKYLNLLPQVSYDALNKSINIGFSLSSLSQYYQQKERNKILVKQLEFRLIEKLDVKIEKLELSIDSFNIELEILKNSVELFKLDASLFSIDKGKYKNAEITIEEFLTIKKDFLYKKNNLKTSLLKLKLKGRKITQKTKSDTSEVSLNILLTQINSYE